MFAIKSHASRLAAVLGVAAVLGALAGFAALPAQTAAAQSIGTITVQKTLVGPNGAAVTGDLSGYTFTIQGASGQVTLQPTAGTGQTQIGVAPGTYTISEVSRAGAELVGFTINGQAVGSFQVIAGQNVALTAINQVAGTGVVQIQKQIVDASGNLVPNANLSNYSFAFTGPNGFTQTVTTGANGVATLQNLAGGNYTVTEAQAAGFQLAQLTINGIPVSNGATFPVTAGATTTIVASNRAVSTGNVSITKNIVDQNGNVVASGDRAGFRFNFTAGNITTTSDATVVSGTASLSLAPGTYTFREQDRAGCTFRNGTVNGQTINQNDSFTVLAGQTYNIIVNNTCGAAQGNVTITKNIVDQNGAVIASADRTGFRFTFVAGNTTITSDATVASGASSANLAPGTYTFREVARTDRTGCTFRSATVNGQVINPGDAFTVTAGQSYAIIVNNTCTGGGPTETVPLFATCNNVSLTWPVGTPLSVVAAAVTPASSLESIFRYDNALGRFFGFSPTAPAFANDYNTVTQRFEAVFICMRTAGTLERPVV